MWFVNSNKLPFNIQWMNCEEINDTLLYWLFNRHYCYNSRKAIMRHMKGCIVQCCERVVVGLGLWRSRLSVAGVGLLFWHGCWYIYSSAGAKPSSISGWREGAVFSTTCSPSQLLTCKCASESSTPTDSRESWPALDESGAFEISDWPAFSQAGIWCAGLCFISN